MHIYSSPRNMSVNFGSVSTKHEQHSLPNRLYPRQIWHCAHSFCFVSFYIYFFWSLNHPYLLCFWCIIWKNSTKISRRFSFFFYFSRSLCRRYFNPAPSPPLSPSSIHSLAAPSFVFVTGVVVLSDDVSVCDGTRAPFWSRWECWKHCVTDCRGAQASPLGVVTSLFIFKCFFFYLFFCMFGVRVVYESERLRDVNKKTKINLPKQHIPWQYMGHLFCFSFLWVSFSVK